MKKKQRLEKWLLISSVGYDTSQEVVIRIQDGPRPSCKWSQKNPINGRKQMGNCGLYIITYFTPTTGFL